MVDVHQSWARLKFKQGFEQRRFVYDFNKIVKCFLEHDVSHSDPYLVTSFIRRLKGINDPQPAMYFFYKQIDSEGIGKLTLQTLQDRFMALNLGESKYTQEYHVIQSSFIVKESSSASEKTLPDKEETKLVASSKIPIICKKSMLQWAGKTNANKRTNQLKKEGKCSQSADYRKSQSEGDCERTRSEQRKR